MRRTRLSSRWLPYSWKLQKGLKENPKVIAVWHRLVVPYRRLFQQVLDHASEYSVPILCIHSNPGSPSESTSLCRA